MKYYIRLKVFPGVKYVTEYFCSSFPVELGLVGYLIQNGMRGHEYHLPASREEWEAGKDVEEVVYI